jgi:KDO2-lipid IV(A) lauroyltransferase
MPTDAAASSAAWQTEPESFRHRAARFWLNQLFAQSLRAPGFMALTRPFWCEMAWHFGRKLRGNLLANAARLLGPGSTAAQRSRLGRRVIGNFYDFVLDIGRHCGLTAAVLAARAVQTQGREHYDAARAMKRGAIVATAHMGQFEIGIASLKVREPNLHVVFQQDRLRLFDDIRERLHRSLGVRDAPVEAGIENWMTLRQALLDDQVVLMQADRVMPGQRGCRLPFAGGEVEFPWGPVKLAALAGSPIVPVYCLRNADGTVRIVIDEPIGPSLSRDDPRSAMGRLAASIERMVLAHPDQWLCFHRVWLDDLPSRGSRA